MFSRQAIRSGSAFRRLAAVSLVVAVAFALLAIIAPLSLRQSVSDEVKSRSMIDSASTKGYQYWVNLTQPTYLDVWAFNITNPQAVLNGYPANLTEIGPLRYQQQTYRYDVSWLQDNSTGSSTIKYKEWTTYVPIGDTDALSQLNITTINTPVFGMAGQHIDDIYVFLQNCSEQCLFTTRPIRDIIWGYNDSVLDIFGLRFPGYRLNMTSALESWQLLGHSRMYTGSGVSQLNRRVVSWDGMASLNCCNIGSCGPTDRGGDRSATWRGEEANQFDGTFGEQWPAYDTGRFTTLQVFFPEMYRPVPLDVVVDDSVEVFGVPVNRFTLSMTPFLSTTNVSTNDAYYAGGPNGVANITNCAFKASIFVSKPHFLGGDGQLLVNVSGVTPPDPTLHETYYDVEPVTGTVLRRHKRLQINAQVQKTPTYVWPGSFFFQNVSEAIVPVIWFDEHSQVTQDFIDSFDSDVQQPMYWESVTLWIGVGGAAVFALTAAVLWVVSIKRRSAYDAYFNDGASYVSLSKDKAKRTPQRATTRERQDEGQQLLSPLTVEKLNTSIESGYGTS